MKSLNQPISYCHWSPTSECSYYSWSVLARIPYYIKGVLFYFCFQPGSYSFFYFFFCLILCSPFSFFFFSFFLLCCICYLYVYINMCWFCNTFVFLILNIIPMGSIGNILWIFLPWWFKSFYSLCQFSAWIFFYIFLKLKEIDIVVWFISWHSYFNC